MTSLQNSRPVAVLVDAYTTGNHLPPAFARCGVDVVHVQSTPQLMTSMRPPDLTAYRAVLPYGTPEETAARLEQYDPLCVVAGQEPGVKLADDLSERLALPGNGTALSRARRDKFEMIETLRRAGVRCADQFKSDSAEALVEWAESRCTYPVVVKPLSSAATDGVAICHGPGDVRKAAEAVLGTRNIFGETNDEVLIQSFLQGEEYMVDFVSYDGRRHACGIWQYRKRLRGTHRIYDRDSITPPDSSPAPEIIAYMHEVLDALGLRFGPTHAEVIVTPQGPTLVEIGARLTGGVVPDFHDLCLGANQADLTALAYSRPEEFVDRYASRTYRKLREASLVFTATELNGVVDSLDEQVIAEIEALESVRLLTPKLAPGSRIRPTVDLYTATLVVHTANESPEALERDYARIQELKDRVYRLRGNPEADRDH
ncbi:ATP-grasp domain-containing protein [Streptomyces sp. 1222.5]|uniref:ATP-grasp domain-containing protein n=1 Tax=unclassified Streptomyces TaxID=2593676 RepID=UPI000894D759|nr:MULTISPECIES: ATP-grasp domain-containing protein [unclassified Streptomyces]PKW00393.1 ATP-grasp domain-containing protein [Streptomyces sp. 5112.2]SED86928.1 ATP-grasp domain-containing protein [Streptomyces sp. 1222.5]